MKRSLILAFAFWGLAAQGSPVQAQKKGAEPEEFLLLQRIVQNDQLQERTLWVKTSSRGAEILGEFDHPLMAVGETLYALLPEPSQYQSYDCADLSKGSDEAGNQKMPVALKDHSYQRSLLKAVTAENAEPIWSSPVAPFNPQATEVTDRCGHYSPKTTVSGFAGPYLSLQLCEDLDRCGAHGAVNCQGLFFNLESGKAIDLNDIKQFSLPNPKEQKALKWALNAEPLTEGEEITPEIWRSQYGAKGLEVSLLMTCTTDYFSSSPEWSSYSTSAVFLQKQIPKDFAPYKALPKGLAEFAKSKEAKLIGFSKAPKNEAAQQYLKAHAKPAASAQ